MGRPVHGEELASALAEAEAAGILPLTSACNVSCLFCSNRANPPGVRAYSLPPRPLAEVERALRRMAHLPELVIGESASRISEGEPLTYPDFDAVARSIRSLVPRATIKLTTNGVLLDRRRAGLLGELAPVEVTLSLNTASPKAYQALHGRAHDPRLAPEALAWAGVPFQASVVAVPAVTGEKDLGDTLRYLQTQGCLGCRVFVPGYTSFTAPAVRGLLPSPEEVERLVAEARATVGFPATLEPPRLDDLEARLVGVTPGSPASRAGLRAGDVIDSVEGERPFSRVEAFRRCLEALRRRGRCRLSLRGRGEATLKREEGESPEVVRPGFVMDRDLDPDDVALVLDQAARLKARRVVVLTSSLARWVMARGFAFPPVAAAGVSAAVVAVPSRTFGGSIACAGLLTVADFEEALASPGLIRPGDAVFLPPLAFDRSGLDLLGRWPGELAARLPAGARLVVPGVLSL